MTITRARKAAPAAAKTEKAELTAEQFIAAADTAPPPSAAPAAAATATTESHIERERRAVAIVGKYVPWSAGAGVLPIPGVDLAAIIGVQLRMLSAVAKEYDVPFKKHSAKSVVAALMASVLQNTVAGSLAAALKFIPGVGTAVGIAALPALAAAGTYAVGKVFVTHFEAGGTFLDLDPTKVRAHFQREFEQARKNA